MSTKSKPNNRSLLNQSIRRKQAPSHLMKAHRFFQDKKLPAPLTHLPYTTGCLSPKTRPPKPLVQDVPDTNPDDPFYRIEKSANTINSLFQAYQEQQEDSQFQMLAELDSAFAVNALEPKEILLQSRKNVDNLINQNKELKDHQTSMLEAIQAWMIHEEQSLRNQDDTFRQISQDVFNTPQTSNDLIDALNSETGTKQERITRAVSIHSDIVSKAFLAIHEYQRKDNEQQKLIKDLQAKCSSMATQMSSMKRPRVHTPNNNKVNELQKQLDQALSQIQVQEETIKKLNGKIETLIGQNVVSTLNSSRTEANEADSIQKQQNIFNLEIQVAKLQTEIATLNETKLKMDKKINSLESDNAYYSSQIDSLNSMIEIEREKRDSQLRDFLNKIQEIDEQNENSKNSERDSTKSREVQLLKRIAEQEKEIEQMKAKRIEDTQNMHKQNQRNMEMLRREFETREADAQKRQIYEKASEQDREYIKSIEKQFEITKQNIKADYDTKMQELISSHTKEMRKALSEKDAKILETQKLLEDMIKEKGSIDVTASIDRVKKEYEEKESSLRAEQNAKLEEVRNDFQKHQQKLLNTIKEKDAQISKMMQVLCDQQSQSHEQMEQMKHSMPIEDSVQSEQEKEEIEEETAKDDEINDNDKSNEMKIQRIVEMRITQKLRDQKMAIDQAWEEQITELADQLDTQKAVSEKTIDDLLSKIAALEKENADLKVRNDFEELRTENRLLSEKAEKAESEWRKLQVENQLLKKAFENGTNNEMALLDLTSSFSQQTNELEMAHQKLAGALEHIEELRSENSDLKQLEAKLREKILSLACQQGSETLVREHKYETIYSDIFGLSEPSEKPKLILEAQTPKTYKSFFQVTCNISPDIEEIIKKKAKLHPVESKTVLEISAILHNFELNRIGNPNFEIYLNDDDEIKEEPLRNDYRSITKLTQCFTNHFALPNYSEAPSSEQQGMKNEVQNFVNRDVPVLGRISTMKMEVNLQMMSIPPYYRNMCFLKNCIIDSIEPRFSSTKSIFNRIPLTIENENIENEKTDVACQFASDSSHLSHSNLTIMPSIEIFGLSNGVLYPEFDIEMNPSIVIMEKLSQDKATHLITADGNLMNIPKNPDQIDHTTHPLVIDAMTNNVVNSTIGLSKQLRLVVSEMQAIEQETNPIKKSNMQKTMGTTLEVEKDSLVSEMKERITELEQLMQTTNKDTTRPHSTHHYTKSKNQLEIHRGLSEEIIGSPSSKHFSTQSESFTYAPAETEEQIVNQKSYVDESVQNVQSCIASIVKDVDSLTMETRSVSSLSTLNAEVQTSLNNLETMSQSEVRLSFSNSIVVNENLSQSQVQLGFSNNIIADDVGNGNPGKLSPAKPRKQYSDANTSTDIQNTNETDQNQTPKIKRLPVKINNLPTPSSNNKKTFVVVNNDPIDITATYDITSLRQQLSEVQSNDPHEALKALDNIEMTLDNAKTDNTNKYIQLSEIVNTSSVVFTTSEANMMQALDATENLATRLIEHQTYHLLSQDQIMTSLNKVASDFLMEMDKPGGATAVDQSTFLRNITKIATDLNSTLSKLHAEIDNNTQLKSSLQLAKDELANQGQLIRSLRQEIIDLKSYNDASPILSQYIDLKEDLEKLTKAQNKDGNQIGTKLLSNIQEAVKFVPNFLRRTASDATVIASGATNYISRATDYVPNWPKVISVLGTIIELLNNNLMNNRNKEIINQLRNQNDEMINEIKILKSEKIVQGRDISAFKMAQNRHITQLKSSIESANDQIMMLERQLQTKNFSQEVETAHQLEKESRIKLDEEIKKSNNLSTALNETREQLASLQKRFQDMFNQATDTQTTNQILQSRADEIIMKADIDANKVRMLEKINEKTSAELEEEYKKVDFLQDQNAELQNQVTQLEASIEDMKRRHLDEMTSKILHNPIDVNVAQSELPRLVKLYQQRASLYQDQLDKKSHDIMKINSRRAQDQRSLILLQRDSDHLTSKLKVLQLRYEASKSELLLSQKSIAYRDDTIRALKREIMRLRNLLKNNAAPLKDKLQLMDIEKNENYEELKKTQEEIERAQRIKEQYKDTNKPISNYFDNMLKRHRETLAKLEQRRGEIQENEKRNEYENLRALSQIVHESELNIPEEVVLQLMPHPQPVRTKALIMMKMNKQKKLIIDQENSHNNNNIVLDSHMVDVDDPQHIQTKVKTTSYADTLQILGSLLGKKSPQTLQRMLRNARYNNITVIMPERKPPMPKKGQKNIPSLAVHPIKIPK